MMIHSIPDSKFNKYFTAFGKALVIAEKFEDSCKFILQHALFESELKTNKIDIIDLIDPNSKKGNELRKRTMGRIAKNDGPSIVNNKVLNDFAISKLINAIDSRNWLAHESMKSIGYSFGEKHTLEVIKKALKELKNHITNIAIGEYICGAIEIQMNNKIPFYDEDQQNFYAKKIKEWVFDYSGKITLGFNILHLHAYEKYKKIKPIPATY